MLFALSLLTLGLFTRSIVAATAPAAPTPTAAAAPHMNITALAGKNGISVLECWQLITPFTVSNTAGTSGTAIQQLGDVANTSYVIIPPKFDGGLHNGPVNQWV